MNLPLYFSNNSQTCSRGDVARGDDNNSVAGMLWANRSRRSKNRLSKLLVVGVVWVIALILYAVTIQRGFHLFTWRFESSFDPILTRTEILTSTRIWDYIEKNEYQEKGLYYSKDVKFDLTVKRELTEISNFCENQNCTSSAIQSAQDNSSIYYFYQSVPFEEFIKTNLTITCDYVIFSPVYAKKSGTNQYTVFSDWIRFHYADLPFSCYFLLHLPPLDGVGTSYFQKHRSCILTLLSIANGVIVSRKSSGVLFDRSVMGPFGLRKHSHSHLVPWMVLTDLDMIITNNKKSLQTLLDKVEDALTRPAVVQNPESDDPKSINDVDVIMAAGYYCDVFYCELNSGFIVLKPSETVFTFLSRLLNQKVGFEDDQYSWVVGLYRTYHLRQFKKPDISFVCTNQTVWDQAENDLIAVLAEDLTVEAHNDENVENLFQEFSRRNLHDRERGHAVVVSPRWMNANACRRVPFDEVAFRLRSWRPGDWQAHIYGCGHPTKKEKIDFFIDALKNDSSNVDFPRQLKFYNWSEPDAFKF